MSRPASRRGAVGAFIPYKTRPSTAVEYASMRSARMNILAGTALALILAAAPDAGAAPQASSGAPAQRDYTTPGSTTKPTPIMPADDGIRFRNTMPDSRSPLQPRQDATPLSPAAPAAPAARVAPAPAPAPAPAAKAEPAPA